MAAPRTTGSPARPSALLAVGTLLASVAALLALSGTAHAQDLNCRDDFTYQEDAQDVLDQDRDDPHHLDDDRDGIACETLPRRGTAGTVTSTTSVTPTTTTAVNALFSSAGTSSTSPTESTTWTTVTTTSSSDSDDDSGSSSDSDSGSDSGSDSDDNGSSTGSDDKNCPDFASQADAQAALTAEPSDPDNLDADDDGIACEDHFGEEGQQVQVHPAGGVDTGGEPADAG